MTKICPHCSCPQEIPGDGEFTCPNCSEINDFTAEVETEKIVIAWKGKRYLKYLIGEYSPNTTMRTLINSELSK